MAYVTQSLSVVHSPAMPPTEAVRTRRGDVAPATGLLVALFVSALLWMLPVIGWMSLR